MKQYDSSVEELFEVQQYTLMNKNMQDLQKLTLIFKKFFEDILNKQMDLCESSLDLTQKVINKNLQYIPVGKSLENLGQVINIISQTVSELFVNIKSGNSIQQNHLHEYQQDTSQCIDKFIKYKDEYILNAIKYYKNDEQQYKKNVEHLKNCKQQYTEALELYKQTENDPSMLYNYNLKQERYKVVQHKIKKFKECEQQIKTCLEILNSRRKSLCIDLLELKKIIEETHQQILLLTHKVSVKNIATLIQVVDSWQRSLRNRSARQFFTILPEAQRFNFDKISRQQDFQQLLFLQRNLMNKIDEDDDIAPQSFRTIRDVPSVNQSFSSINDQNMQQMPNFLTQDIQQVPNSQLIQYYEWISTYVKVVKDNCTGGNSLMLKLLQLIDGIMNSFRKQGKPCISLQDQKNMQQPFIELKWFEMFQKAFGEIGVLDLQAQTQINDLFNLFAMQFSLYLKPKQQSIMNLQEAIINLQNITFSSIDKQMLDLQNMHQIYLKQQGLIINNRTIALNTMDSNMKQQRTQIQVKYQVNQNEQQFRQMISATNKAVVHLIIELDNQSCKYYRTVSEIVDSITNQFSTQLNDVVQFEYQQPNQKQLMRQCKDQILSYLRQQKAYQLFYKFRRNQSILEELINESHDYVYYSDNDFKQFQTLPKPMITHDQEEDDIQSEISTKEQDKEKAEQLKFISSKLKADLNENLIGSFACALAERIQLQGRLYITNKRLFFHSNFNSSNLFFGDTILNIPKGDILYIQKKTNAFIFDNSISIFTPKGQVFFATFFQRDIAYDLIIKTFSPKEQPELMAQGPSADQINTIKVVNINYTQEQIIQISERQDKLLKLMGPDPEQFIQEVIFEFQDIRIFYKLIYGDKMPNQTTSFFERMKRGPLMCDKLELTPWTPAPPLDYDADFGTLNLLECPDFVERQFSCLQPLPKSSIPFMPTVCECKETQRIYFLNRDCFILDLKVQTMKVPYADAFYVDVRYKFQQIEQGIKMECRIRNVFVKSVLVKKGIQTIYEVIEKASQDEITEKTNEKIVPAMKAELQNYLKGSINNEPEEQPEELSKVQAQQNTLTKLPLLKIGSALLIAIVVYYLYCEVLCKLKITIQLEK